MTSFTTGRSGISTLPADWTPKHPNLAAALAAFQAKLPSVGKDNTANIPTKTGGKYTYTYADLADVSGVVLPLLGEEGLCFTAFPTVEAAVFGLSYSLQHEGGEHWDGFYPLPDPTRAGAQDVGSAITYARRYTLSAVVGIAPDEDDDGNAAQQYHERDRAPQRSYGAASGAPEREPEPAIPPHLAFLDRIADWADEHSVPKPHIARAFHVLYGTELGDETSVHRLGAVLRILQQEGIEGLSPVAPAGSVGSLPGPDDMSNRAE